MIAPDLSILSSYLMKPPPRIKSRQIRKKNSKKNSSHLRLVQPTRESSFREIVPSRFPGVIPSVIAFYGGCQYDLNRVPNASEDDLSNPDIIEKRLKRCPRPLTKFIYAIHELSGCYAQIDGIDFSSHDAYLSDQLEKMFHYTESDFNIGYLLDHASISFLNHYAHNLAKEIADLQTGDIVKIDLTSMENYKYYDDIPMDLLVSMCHMGATIEKLNQWASKSSFNPVNHTFTSSRESSLSNLN